MADLEKLEEKYRAAQEKYEASDSEKDKKAYKKAKDDFASARREQRAAEGATFGASAEGN